MPSGRYPGPKLGSANGAKCSETAKPDFAKGPSPPEPRAEAGPRLRGVYGRPAGSVASFPYSESIRKSGVTWDGSSLDKWLTNPDGFIPDNDMAFRVTNSEERAAIIDYLKDVSRK